MFVLSLIFYWKACSSNRLRLALHFGVQFFWDVGMDFGTLSRLSSSATDGNLAPEGHVLLVCGTLLLAAVGRDVSTLSLGERWRWVTTSLLFQLFGLFAATLSLTRASAAGLLTATTLLGCAAFLVVVPRRGLTVRTALSCLLFTLLIASVLTPVLLPALLPATSLTLAQTNGQSAFVVPFGGARVYFPPSLPVVANPVLNVFDSVEISTLVPRSPMTLHRTLILSSGHGVRLTQLNLTLIAGSSVALLGGDSSIENCTLRCDVWPCLWLRKSHAHTAVLQDVRFANGADQWYVASSGAGGYEVTCDRRADHYIPAIGCLDTEDGTPSAVLSTSPATDRTNKKKSSGVAIDMQMLRSVSPLSMLALEHVPALLSFFSAVGRSALKWIVQPLCALLADVAKRLISFGLPVLQSSYLFSCKLITAVSCRAVNLHIFQRVHCEEAMRLYESDVQFVLMQSGIDLVEDALKDFHEIPVLSPSLRIAWGLESSAALWSWKTAGAIFLLILSGVRWVWPILSAFAFGPLFTAVEYVMQGVARLMCWSIVVSLRSSVLDSWAWDANAAILRGVGLLLQPFLSLCSMMLAAVWSLLRVYLTTSFSTQLLVVFLQTALLGLILYRDFRTRVTSRSQEQSWFMRTVTAVPLAVAAMFRHYSKRAATYLVLHLLGVILVVGTSVIPFGGALYTVALQIMLPAASTYGWSIFFHDLETDTAFWWRLSSSCFVKGIMCVLIQKTLGDFVFHIVWEVCMGMGMVGVGFMGMLWVRRGKMGQGGGASPPPSPVVEFVGATENSREIH